MAPAGGRGVRARDVVFLVAAVVLSAIFVRLGFWQLSRLSERRARNALVIARLGEPAVALGALPRDSAEAHYRRAHIRGTYDFAHQVVFVNRIRDGAPGVQLVTPVMPDSGVLGDTVVLVDRGWVYAPDGTTVDTAAWREPVHLDGTGYVQQYFVLGHVSGGAAGASELVSLSRSRGHRAVSGPAGGGLLRGAGLGRGGGARGGCRSGYRRHRSMRGRI